MGKREKEKIETLVNLWEGEIKRIAVLHPIKNYVRFDGWKKVKTSEAVEMMMREVPEEKIDKAGI